ncbi:MAG: UvrD-helicase domain-containing protein [Akkermansiaceae bacterium]|nr:UvrD-helicase domain-containing protein [Akkermansiaceae bacterium]MCP5546214.1 UvrD-helicase domain-containing protein [Akkermansiaceae bacterium]
MKISAKNLLVLASAGSGKTYQLGNRIISSLVRGAPPRSIAALTFTRKAAGEFADSVLTKLARAAADPSAADLLKRDIQNSEADFPELLETTVRGLPEITFGTMDSFFASVVRGFQFELGLTGGPFDLIEGPRARILADDLIASILGSAFGSERGGEFLHAFRRATIGREEQGVLDPLRRSVDTWLELHRSRSESDWGDPPFETREPVVWEEEKHQLGAKARSLIDSIEFTRKGQREAMENAIQSISEHTIGSGSLNSAGSLLDSLLAATAEEGDLVLRFYKEFTVHGPAAEALKKLVHLAAACEAGAALQRTRAIREVVSHYDERKETIHRIAGRLGFDDVKHLMGRWARDEDARLRRESVDFRIDARIDHWLLDEFQDTSRADWTALHPLLDEAITREDATTFIVGDRKQAIYAWRGGDVGLFDEILEGYRGGFEIEPMVESWRSSPEVLEFVNQVCGDEETLPQLFGDATRTWLADWQDHVSASPLRSPAHRGEVRVEIIGDREARWQRLTEILKENHAGTKNLVCGVLLRSNSLVRDVADHLRNEGFDVIEEGARHPAHDNQPGLLIHRLLRWLADPADQEALEFLYMTPALGLGDHEFDIANLWTQWTESISRCGFAATASSFLENLIPRLHRFGVRRFEDLIQQLELLDASGCCSPSEAAEWLEHLEVSQSPGAGAIQVMTVHKSKGLGFDLVVLPELSNDIIPKANQFETATGPGWILQAPPRWARRMFPPLRKAEEDWGRQQRHEAICGLYVALTRAKRGLYLLLDPAPANEKDPDHPSLAHWIRSSTGCSTDNPIYQIGRSGWSSGLDDIEESQDEPPTPDRDVRPRVSMLSYGTRLRPRSRLAVEHGVHIHSLLQSISWIDDPDVPIPQEISTLVSRPELAPVFQRQGREIQLLREQPVLSEDATGHVSGVIDRLHLHQSPERRVPLVEIIDFKTDKVSSTAELVDRHAAQLDRYAAWIAKIHPEAQISRVLVSVPLGELVRL